MHKIPNLPLGKVAHRSVVRVFFPRMYRYADTRKVPSADIELIYNQCLRPIVQRLMPNQATHWPATYEIALRTSRDKAGRLHLGTLDIPAHLLSEFTRQYLEHLSQLRPYFQDAYFGHELRGWKAATVHNVGDADEEAGGIHERVDALEDLTRILDMDVIRPDQWLVDVGLQFGVSGQVLTWRSIGHNALLRHLFPDIPDIERATKRSKTFYVDPQMQMKDIAGFRWTPSQASDWIIYLQAYTTEKSVSYQLHDSIFRERKPSELLTRRNREKLLSDLDQQSTILYTCAGNNATNPNSTRQEGCARLEVRVYLSEANEILTQFPRALINRTMVQISAQLWWCVCMYLPFRDSPDISFRHFKWLRLAAVFMIVNNIHKNNPSDYASENSLALGALSIWIMNSVYRTPNTRFLHLAKEASPQILLHEDDDPFDEDAETIPLMDEAGVYFFCDVVVDHRMKCLRIAWAKSFSPRLIAEAYEQGTLNDVRRLLGCSQVETGQRTVNPQRTANRSAQHTIDARNFRTADEPLPRIGRRLDGLGIPGPRRPHGPDVDYFRQHGGGTRDLIEDATPQGEAADNPLKQHVQEILLQLYYDILSESPNKRSRLEGAWTNIPNSLRAEHAVEDLYLQLEFPFTAVQYVTSTDAQWETHFNRFFPPKIPGHAGQNFGKCRYYHTYLTLVNYLPPRHLSWVRMELHDKFNSLAWIPFTECDRMWSTRKANPQRWKHLPVNGPMEGPRIAIHPTAIRKLRKQPALRPAPADLLEEEEEEEEEVAALAVVGAQREEEEEEE